MVQGEESGEKEKKKEFIRKDCARNALKSTIPSRTG